MSRRPGWLFLGYHSRIACPPRGSLGAFGDLRSEGEVIRKPAKVSQGGGEAQHSGKVPPPGVSPATTVAGRLVGVLLSIVLVAMGPSAQQPHSYYAPRGPGPRWAFGGHTGHPTGTDAEALLRDGR